MLQIYMPELNFQALFRLILCHGNVKKDELFVSQTVSEYSREKAAYLGLIIFVFRVLA